MTAPDANDVVGRALRRLPPPRAPQTLLPRVVLAAEQWTARPWYRRAWKSWPKQWQVVSAGACMALLMVLAWFGLYAGMFTGPLLGLLPLPTDRVVWLSEVVGQAEAAANALQVIWQATLAPVSSYVLASVSLMTAACAVIAVALERVLYGKAFEV